MEPEDKKRIEEVFINRMKMQSIKLGSKTFHNLQMEFFIGAMSALQEEPPIWVICLMSGREIVKY